MTEPSPPSAEVPRKRFEMLLDQAMKSAARKPLKEGERTMIESSRTFREGFKFALQTLGLIEYSTTELKPRQFEIMIREMDRILGNVPPPPEQL